MNENEILIKNFIKKKFDYENISESFALISEHFIFYRKEYVDTFNQKYLTFKQFYFDFIKSIHDKDRKKYNEIFSNDNNIEAYQYLELSIRSLLVRRNYLDRKINLKNGNSFIIIRETIKEYTSKLP